MMKRSFVWVGLVLIVVALAATSAQAIPIPSKQCAYKCTSSTPCSEPCWAQIVGGGAWFSINCGQYVDEWEWEGGGSGSCQGLTGDGVSSDLERFLRSLESLAETGPATP